MSQVLLRKGLEEHFQDTIANLGQAYIDKHISPEIDSYTSTSELHQLRVKTACLDSILRREREKHAQRREHFKQRWRIAADNLRQVDVSITNLEHVYKENVAETNRQTYLAARQDELVASKRLGVQKLLKEKALLTHVRAEATERLENFNPVKKYLTNVIDTSRGEFANARELIERAKLLLSTRTELVSRNEAAEERLRRREQTLEKFDAVKTNEIILLNNHVFELGQDLIEAGETMRKIEDEVARIKTTASNRTMILGQIRAAAYNIYVQMCDAMKIEPKIKPEDTIKLLAAVKTSMTEAKKIEAMVKYFVKKAKQKAAAEKAEHERRRKSIMAEARAREMAKRRQTETERARELFGLRALTSRSKSKHHEDVHRMMRRVTKDSKIALKTHGSHAHAHEHD